MKYIFFTLLFTVYGQLVLKWQISKSGELPLDWINKLKFLLLQLLNPWRFSGFVSAFLASLFWMAAMTKFRLSYAYPFMSLAFVLVMLFSVMFLGETLTSGKSIGTALVVTGLVVLSRSIN